MDAEFLIPIFLFGSTAAVLIVYFNNRHRERMVMIEKGVNPADFKGMTLREYFRSNPYSSLKWGMLAIGVGFGLALANYAERTLYFDDSVYFSGMLIFGGIALVLYYRIASRKVNQEE
jgi:hypothetical protein